MAIGMTAGMLEIGHVKVVMIVTGYHCQGTSGRFVMNLLAVLPAISVMVSEDKLKIKNNGTPANETILEMVPGMFLENLPEISHLEGSQMHAIYSRPLTIEIDNQ